MARDLIADYFTDESTLRALLEYGPTFPTSANLLRIARGVVNYFERRCRQTLAPVTLTRRYCGDGTRILRLDRAIVSISALVVDGETIDHTTKILTGVEFGGIDSQAWHRDPRLVLEPDHPDLTAWPKPTYRGVPPIVITGVWGACGGDEDTPTIHDEVLEALLRTIADNVAGPADVDLRLMKRAPASPMQSGGGRTTRTAVHGRGKIVVDPWAEAVIREHAASMRLRSTL